MRDHLRAALIAVALFFNGVAASPLPKSVKRSQFENPIAVEELGRWVEILGSVGIHTTPAAIADRSFTVGSYFADIRGTLLKPIRGWFRLSGTGQAWGLFTYPDVFPNQLVVEVRPQGGEWRTVYAGLDPDATWNHDVLVYRRIRGLYDGNTNKPGPSYENFTKWIGREALADFPDAAEARVGFIRFHSVQPGRPPDPTREARFQRVVKR